MSDSSAGTAPAPAALAPGGDTVVRGAALAFAAQIAGGVFTAGLTIFLSRRLGAAGYGVFALALSLESVLYLVADAGIGQSLERFVAVHQRDAGTVRELVADAIALKIVTSILVAGALAALAGLLASAYGSPRLEWTLRGIAVSLIGMNLMLMCRGVFSALRRQSFTLVTFFSESAVEFTASVLLVLAFGGPVAAAFGRGIGYLVGGLTALVLLHRLTGRGRLTGLRGPRPHARRILGYAGPMMVVDGVYVLYAQVDSLLIGAFLTVASVGIWQAPVKLTTLLLYPGQAIATAVAPRLIASEEVGRFESAVRLLIVFMAAVTVLMTVWAVPIIALVLGPKFSKSSEVLRILAPFVFLNGLGPLVTVTMNYLGAGRRRVRIAFATLLVNLVLDLILIPNVGVIGGAIGSDVAVAIYVGAHFAYCQRALTVAWTPMVRTLGRSIAAAGAMTAVLVWFGTGKLAIGTMFGGGALGVAAFGAVILLSGEYSPGQLRALLRRRQAAVDRKTTDSPGPG